MDSCKVWKNSDSLALSLSLPLFRARAHTHTRRAPYIFTVCRSRESARQWHLYTCAHVGDQRILCVVCGVRTHEKFWETLIESVLGCLKSLPQDCRRIYQKTYANMCVRDITYDVRYTDSPTHTHARTHTHAQDGGSRACAAIYSRSASRNKKISVHIRTAEVPRSVDHLLYSEFI